LAFIIVSEIGFSVKMVLSSLNISGKIVKYGKDHPYVKAVSEDKIAV